MVMKIPKRRNRARKSLQKMEKTLVATQQRVLRATIHRLKKTLKSQKKMKKKLIKRQDRMLSTIKEPKNPTETALNKIPRKEL